MPTITPIFLSQNTPLEVIPASLIRKKGGGLRKERSAESSRVTAPGRKSQLAAEKSLAKVIPIARTPCPITLNPQISKRRKRNVRKTAKKLLSNRTTLLELLSFLEMKDFLQFSTIRRNLYIESKYRKTLSPYVRLRVMLVSSRSSHFVNQPTVLHLCRASRPRNASCSGNSRPASSRK